MSATGQTRDEEFAAFAHARLPALMGTAVLLTGNREDAQDLVQTTLTKTFVHWRRIVNQENPDAYVRRILINVHLTWRRRLARITSFEPARREPLAPDAFSAVEERDSLRRALLSLPPRQRTAVILRHYEDLSEIETARVLGCSVGNVKSLTSRALTALRAFAPHASDADHELQLGVSGRNR